jgi:ADP-ribose pyrophosphatase
VQSSVRPFVGGAAPAAMVATGEACHDRPTCGGPHREDCILGGDEKAVWRRIGGRVVHETPFLTLREDRVLTPDGRESTYGVVACGHCVGVLPLFEDGSVAMVRQHRYIADRFTWEMPTGGVHAGESPEQAAQRELAEESGFRAGALEHLCTYHTSKSSIDETAHLYLGADLEPAEAEPDDTEFIERARMPLEQVLAMVLDGEITDSMTIIAVLHVARRLGV